MKTRCTWLLFLLLWICSYHSVWAQVSVPANLSICGTPVLSPEQVRDLQKRMVEIKKKLAANNAATTITYIPIRPHIIRRSDGSGGFALANLNQAIAMTNKYFLKNGFGIQFFFAGETPDYINSDELYNNFTTTHVPTLYPYDVANALNQYYPYQLDNPAMGGYAYLPFDAIYSTRSVIATYPNMDYVCNYLIPHELGHTFSLPHTFGYFNGTFPSKELVTRGAGANCDTEGDEICDTPADPFLIGSTSVVVTNVDGCAHYDTSSTARDANGERYTPMVDNFMSYYPHYDGCSQTFTEGQYERMQAGLALRQSHTFYNLSFPATAVTPVSNLSLTYASNSIALNWQDNATNEMGYFIERSTSPTAGFIAIGGVAPNVTTFTDTDILTNMLYYYRIRPSNTTTNHLSPTVAISTCAAPQYPSLNPSRVSANLYWVIQVGQTYTVRWRSASNSEWNLIEGISSVPCTLTGLTASTTYEWAVQSVCSATSASPFVAGQTFTTYSCTAPYFLSNTGATPSSVGLFWYVSPADPGRTFDLRYRAAGSSDWITINGITSQSYSLTGLPTNVTYEWQVKSVCSPTENSDFTASATFTTSCRPPVITNTLASLTSANLQWSQGFPGGAQSFQIRYRPVSSENWATVSSTTSPYILSGLLPDVAYEWQVASVCSVSAVSDFSSSANFSTGCFPPKPQDLQTSEATESSIKLTWFAGADPGTRFTLYYRRTGTVTWTTVSNLTATTTNGVYTSGTYNLTGLSGSTIYEWALGTACSPTQNSTFTVGPSFMTLCPEPVNLYPAVFVTSAYLYWSPMGPDIQYEARYRQAGTANDWTTITNIGSTTVALTGLRSNTAYDWQIRSLCGNGSTSHFSSVRTFYTPGCSIPTNLQTTNLANTSARLNWSFLADNADTRYQGRYRAVGASEWIVLDNLTSTDGVGYTVINGLTTGTAYEWQIRTLCSPSENSAFSNSSTFYTTAPCDGMYTLKAGSWSDPTVWSCNRTPTSSDVVALRHVVNLPVSYVATAQRLQVNSGITLTYGANARLILGF